MNPVNNQPGLPSNRLILDPPRFIKSYIKQVGDGPEWLVLFRKDTENQVTLIYEVEEREPESPPSTQIIGTQVNQNQIAARSNNSTSSAFSTGSSAGSSG